jgi:8-oxo-dGTP pyrophosphatase MutT (NUDIX family)
VITDPTGRVLLVRERHADDWSLPGGAVSRKDVKYQGICGVGGAIHQRCYDKGGGLGDYSGSCGKPVRVGGTSQRAAVREIREELGLEVESVAFLFDHHSSVQKHVVYGATLPPKGKITLDRRELSEFRWWDRSEALNLRSSARAILERLAGREALGH